MTEASASPHTDADTPGARERLLEATIHLAGRYGQKRVTYRSVAAEAGVAHGLVRFYFGSRQALLTEALDLAARRDANETGLVADDIDTFGADLIATLTTHGERQFLQYDYLLSAVRGTAPVDKVVGHYDRYIAQIANTLSRLGIDDPDDTLAALVFACLDGLTLQHAIYDSAERTEQILDRLRDLLRLIKSAQPR